jgi:hypothetical protein
MHSLELVNQPLQRQLRGLNVALRGGSPERAREHARNAVALVNEATDLDLRAEDLLLALAEGAREGHKGSEILDRLLERGIHRRLLSRGSLVVGEQGARFTRLPGDLRDEVRGLLGSDSSGSLGDPRWDDLLGGAEDA